MSTDLIDKLPDYARDFFEEILAQIWLNHAEFGKLESYEQIPCQERYLLEFKALKRTKKYYDIT